MGIDDPLYSFFVSLIAAVVEYEKEPVYTVLIEHIPSILCDVTITLTSYLRNKLERDPLDHDKGILEGLMHAFKVFLKFVTSRIVYRNTVCDSLLVLDVGKSNGFYKEVKIIISVLDICFKELDKCLDIVQTVRLTKLSCRILMRILKELMDCSKHFLGTKETVLQKIKWRSEQVSYIMIGFGKHEDTWLLDYKDLLSAVARLSLLRKLLPEIQENIVFSIEIDRSRILSESYDFVMNVSRDMLLANLTTQFNGDADAGNGVTREWFGTLFEAIFTGASIGVGRCLRFPRIYEFTGIMIALALIHGIPIGICLDKVVFEMMAGNEVVWKDTFYQEPFLYRSCESVLRMDENTLRQMDQKFIWEIHGVEQELCENGSTIVVGKENRTRFVELLTQRRIAEPISQMVYEIVAGFSRITDGLESTQSFFKKIDFPELDQLLLGNTIISVDDWKIRTDLKGFEPNDNVVIWFWQMVTNMTMKDRASLLFYWSSFKSIPIGGFRYLPAFKIAIIRDIDIDGLPRARSCLFTLYLPEYSSYSRMVDRFKVVLKAI
ncbi:hypothetical protein CQW23_11227 [Capsicum baccatum]|uniref:HECT-type E3 ubiquitin transferase n=1 Tax=Capsicum baccatum TaxID=33114 RepID=A0A2G2X202_CAPBA|nr:hypothetical protein CQW23_11227 [Capsicum baccatum]